MHAMHVMLSDVFLTVHGKCCDKMHLSRALQLQTCSLHI